MDKLCELMDVDVHSTAHLHLGKNISPVQPDVEVLAVCNRPIPLTEEAFAALAGQGKDFYKMEFYVAKVGPPGFSSVPYISAAKKMSSDKTKTDPLYDLNENGETVMYTFEKSKKNTDKGDRVLEIKVSDEDEATTDARTVLANGVVVTEFMRTDTFGGKFFANSIEDMKRTYPDERIEAGTMVYLQIGICNAEQAAKGRALKVRKLKVADIPTDYLKACNLPETDEAYDAALSKMQKQATVSKQISTGKFKILFKQVANAAFVTYDEDSGKYVLSRMDKSGLDVEIPTNVIEKCCRCVDKETTIRLLNLFINMKACHVLVRKSMLGDTSAAAGEASFSGVALVMVLDIHKQIGSNHLMHALKGTGTSTTFFTEKDDQSVWWMCNSQKMNAGDVQAQVVQRIAFDAKTADKEDGHAVNLVGQNTSGSTYEYMAFLAVDKGDSNAYDVVKGMKTLYEQGMTPFVKLGIQFADQKGSKRRRPTYEITDVVVDAVVAPTKSKKSK